MVLAAERIKEKPREVVVAITPFLRHFQLGDVLARVRKGLSTSGYAHVTVHPLIVDIARGEEVESARQRLLEADFWVAPREYHDWAIKNCHDVFTKKVMERFKTNHPNKLTKLWAHSGGDSETVAKNIMTAIINTLTGKQDFYVLPLENQKVARDTVENYPRPRRAPPVDKTPDKERIENWLKKRRDGD